MPRIQRVTAAEAGRSTGMQPVAAGDLNDP